MPDAGLITTVDTLPPGYLVHGCGVTFDGPPIAPGHSAEVSVEPRHPAYWASVPPGAEIGLYEGPKRVATFTVRQAMSHDAFENWRQRQADNAIDEPAVEAKAARLQQAVEAYSGRKPSRDIGRH